MCFTFCIYFFIIDCVYSTYWHPWLCKTAVGFRGNQSKYAVNYRTLCQWGNEQKCRKISVFVSFVSVKPFTHLISVSKSKKVQSIFLSLVYIYHASLFCRWILHYVKQITVGLINEGFVDKSEFKWDLLPANQKLATNCCILKKARVKGF